MSILQILNHIEMTGSRNSKISILESHKDNLLLEMVFNLALNPNINFYIKKIPDYTPAKPEQADSLDSVLDSLYVLSSRQVTGNSAIEFLTKLLSSLVYDDAKVLERIIKKDLRCGVSDKTANKVWGKNFIPEFPCMLCSPYDEKLIKKIKFPAYVQTKFDGRRFAAIVRDDECTFFSRNGKETNLHGFLEKEFIDLAKGKDVVFDGELLVRDYDGTVMDRKTGNGIINSDMTIDEASRVFATIWDVIPYDDFMIGIYNIPYSQRIANLNTDDTQGKIVVAETTIVMDAIHAEDIFREKLAQGEEGIILKETSSPWIAKRSKSAIKYKAEEDTTLVVVDIIEGTGKYQNMLGAMICETADGIIRVSVGTGFSDQQRIDYFIPEMLGKCVSVKYNMRIKDSGGNESLFLPVFQYIRTDQDANTAEEVK